MSLLPLLHDYDIRHLIEQAVEKEALAAKLAIDGLPFWREHLKDALNAYEMAGNEAGIERVKKALEGTRRDDGPRKDRKVSK